VRQQSLAIVGIDYPNKRGPGRRFELEICKPGEPIELRPEPDNPFDGEQPTLPAAPSSKPQPGLDGFWPDPVYEES
jgi:hypothetical protein